jgi:hypothetical protein
MGGYRRVEANGERNFPLVKLKEDRAVTGSEDILLPAVEMRLEPGVQGPFGMDGQGSETGRAIRLSVSTTYNGRNSGAAADFADVVQPGVVGLQPVLRGVQQLKVVAGKGEFRKYHKPGSVGFGILDQPNVLHGIGHNSPVEGLVLDSGNSQGIAHTFILGNSLAA